MPTYEYHCADCNKTIEIVKQYNDASKVEYCPTCSMKLKRVYSLGGIGFNCSGFYSTDNKTK